MINFNLAGPTDPLVEFTKKLLKLLDVKVTKRTIRKAILRHPYYPGILALSDALTDWNVKNITMQIDVSRLPLLPTPFIAHLQPSHDFDLVIIKGIRNEVVEFSTTMNKKNEIPLEAFIEHWSGVVMVLEPNEASGESNYRANFYNQALDSATPFIYFGFGLIITTLFMTINPGNIKLAYWQNLNWILLPILKYLGMCSCILLLNLQIIGSNPILDQICNSTPKSNCLKVINSKGASILSGLNLSELGFFYFSGSWFLNLLNIFTGEVDLLNFLGILSILSIPIVIFSIIYQWKIIRHWCTLCLVVVFLLTLEQIIFLISNSSLGIHNIIQIMINNIAPIIFAFTIPIVLWYPYKSGLIRFKEMNLQYNQLSRIKNNPLVIEHLTKSQERIPPIPKDLGIQIKSKNWIKSERSVSLIQVSNLYCTACAKVLNQLNLLLEEVENLCITIVFTTHNPSDMEATYQILSINNYYKGQKTMKILNDWYNIGSANYKVFSDKYPVIQSPNSFHTEIDQMNNWCTSIGILHTPTFYINRYPIPPGYNSNDLKNILLTAKKWQ